MLTLSTLVPSLKPCDGETCEEPRKVRESLFFTAIYLISIGTGGHKLSLESFGTDQFDDDHPEERKQKFFNWWNSGLFAGIIFGVTLNLYVQEYVGYMGNGWRDSHFGYGYFSCNIPSWKASL